ncbi:MAG: hypothetical protein LBC75_13445 [Fibromonadaceae bacterium]|jgi:hypothetical protein|nr:hypothetical protein [Fibromonadaceae bacterium]
MKVKKREPLEKEFDYYIANQGKLVKKFNGRVLVIVGGICSWRLSFCSKGIF